MTATRKPHGPLCVSILPSTIRKNRDGLKNRDRFIYLEIAGLDISFSSLKVSTLSCHPMTQEHRSTSLELGTNPIRKPQLGTFCLKKSWRKTMSLRWKVHWKGSWGISWPRTILFTMVCQRRRSYCWFYYWTINRRGYLWKHPSAATAGIYNRTIWLHGC